MRVVFSPAAVLAVNADDDLDALLSGKQLSPGRDTAGKDDEPNYEDDFVGEYVFSGPVNLFLPVSSSFDPCLHLHFTFPCNS
jgi:hypothetical protein